MTMEISILVSLSNFNFILKGDGCSLTCTIEVGYTCNNDNEPSVCISKILNFNNDF